MWMTRQYAEHGARRWLRACMVCLLLCANAAFAESSSPAAELNLAATLDTLDAPLRPIPLTAFTGSPDSDTMPQPLRLDARLTFANPGVASPVPVNPRLESASFSVVRFAFWFGLLLLVSLTSRDTARLFWSLATLPPRERSPLPSASWPLVTIVFESHHPLRLELTLSTLLSLDYPDERLQIIAICPMKDPVIQQALNNVAAKRPGIVSPLPSGKLQTGPERAFTVGLQQGKGEIIFVVPDTGVAPHTCTRTALKMSVEHFFNPSVGLLLGFLPPGPNSARALAPRLASLMRMAADSAGLQSGMGLIPGSALLAMRRAAALACNADRALERGCLAAIHQLSRKGNLHVLINEMPAAGKPVHDWQSRAAWVGERAASFAYTQALGRPRRLHAAQIRTSAVAAIGISALWCLLGFASVLLYFAGDMLSAGVGLAVCMANAYGLNGKPAALQGTAVLFRLYGRRREVSLLSLAPVVFFHDLVTTLRSLLSAIWQRRRSQLAPIDLSVMPESPQ